MDKAAHVLHTNSDQCVASFQDKLTDSMGSKLCNKAIKVAMLQLQLGVQLYLSLCAAGAGQGGAGQHEGMQKPVPRSLTAE